MPPPLLDEPDDVVVEVIGCPDGVSSHHFAPKLSLP
jgi:hypothetical protein